MDHELRVLRNVTISMDEAVAAWARIAAARRDQSVSRHIADVLREKMEADESYEQAQQAFLATAPTASSGGATLPARAEVHDRARLRR